MTARPLRHEWLDAILNLPVNGYDGIDGHAVAVAAALYHHMNAGGHCWPSVRVLAEASRCNHNTVEDRTRRLEAVGLLVVERRRKSVNRYQAAIPAGLSVLPDGTDRRRRSVPSGTETVPPAPQTVPSGAETVPPEGRNCPAPSHGTGEPAKPGEPVNNTGASAGGGQAAASAPVEDVDCGTCAWCNGRKIRRGDVITLTHDEHCDVPHSDECESCHEPRTWRGTTSTTTHTPDCPTFKPHRPTLEQIRERRTQEALDAASADARERLTRVAAEAAS